LPNIISQPSITADTAGELCNLKKSFCLLQPVLKSMRFFGVFLKAPVRTVEVAKMPVKKSFWKSGLVKIIITAVSALFIAFPALHEVVLQVSQLIRVSNSNISLSGDGFDILKILDEGRYLIDHGQILLIFFSILLMITELDELLWSLGQSLISSYNKKQHNLIFRSRRHVIMVLCVICAAVFLLHITPEAISRINFIKLRHFPEPGMALPVAEWYLLNFPDYPRLSLFCVIFFNYMIREYGKLFLCTTIVLFYTVQIVLDQMVNSLINDADALVHALKNGGEKESAGKAGKAREDRKIREISFSACSELKKYRDDCGKVTKLMLDHNGIFGRILFILLAGNLLQLMGTFSWVFRPILFGKDDIGCMNNAFGVIFLLTESVFVTQRCIHSTEMVIKD
jgi:hypothetical protein